MLNTVPKYYKKNMYSNKVKYVVDNNNVLYITFKDKKIDSGYDLINTINVLKPKTIVINNAPNVMFLNKLLSILSITNIETYIILSRKEEYFSNINNDVLMLEDLNNESSINLDKEAKNIRIKAFNPNSEQDAFTTWAHNLDEENKVKLLKFLLDEDKAVFISQEKAIREFIKEMKVISPNILEMSKKDAFNTILDNIYKIDRYKIEKHLNSKRSEILPSNANLLTLLTNNSYLEINCTNVKGQKNHKSHIWNALIDENDVISLYDIDNNIYDASVRSLKEQNYIVNREYPEITMKKRHNNLVNTLNRVIE